MLLVATCLVQPDTFNMKVIIITKVTVHSLAM